MKSLNHYLKGTRFIIFLFLFSITNGYSQNTEWTKNWPLNAQINHHEFKSGIGHVLVGSFNDTVDFDLGPNIHNAISSNYSFFILKLDTSGGFEWLTTIESDTFDSGMELADLKLNSQGEIYLFGRSNSIDLDPSSNLAQFSSSGWLSPCFLVKYSAQGNYLWHHSTNIPMLQAPMAVDSFGNVIIICIGYAGPLNVTLGTDSVSLVGQANESIIAKYSSSGLGLWVKKIRSENPFNPYNYARAKAVSVASDGSIYIAGSFRDSIDFDPSNNTVHYEVGSLSTISLNYCSSFLLKLDENGVFQFVKKQDLTYDIGTILDMAIDNYGKIYQIGKTTAGFNWNEPSNFIRCLNSNGDSLWSKYIEGVDVDFTRIVLDSSKNIYVSGNFSASSFLLDPNLLSSVVYQNPTSSAMGFVARYDSTGNFNWVNNEFYLFNYSLWNSTHFDDLSFDVDGSVYVLNTNYSGLLKIKQDSCSLNFSLSLDSINHVLCGQNGQIFLSNQGGISPINYIWSNGLNGNNIVAIPNPGIYSVVATEQNGCTDSISLLINGPAYQVDFDINTNLQAFGFIPGQQRSTSFQINNLGCLPNNGSAFLVLDPILTYISATIPPNSISGDTLFWNFDTLYYESMIFGVQVNYLVDTSAILGSSVELYLSAMPIIGDVNTNNNVINYTGVVVTSYDPNDITVFPKGKCDEGFIAPNQKLKYTVRFQNTGTSPAINISILDSLDSDLDLNSLRIVGSSHDMYTQILNNNVVKFIFNSINLPDSNANEPGSHGYVVFEIDPLPALSNGVEIENHVGIYFDYNLPVYTNSVLNKVYTGDLATLQCASLAVEENFKPAKIILYPNPANEKIKIKNIQEFDENVMVQISDINGRMVQQVLLDSGVLDISSLEDGIYFVRIFTKDDSYLGRFVKE